MTSYSALAVMIPSLVALVMTLLLAAGADFIDGDSAYFGTGAFEYYLDNKPENVGGGNELDEIDDLGLADH